MPFVLIGTILLFRIQTIIMDVCPAGIIFAQMPNYPFEPSENSGSCARVLQIFLTEPKVLTMTGVGEVTKSNVGRSSNNGANVRMVDNHRQESSARNTT